MRSRSSVSTPRVAKAARKVSAMLSPIQSMLAGFLNLAGSVGKGKDGDVIREQRDRDGREGECDAQTGPHIAQSNSGTA